MDSTTHRLMMGSSSGGLNEPMILVFDTNTGTFSTPTIFLPLYGSPLSVNVDWGDGSFDVVTQEGLFQHNYATHGIYTVKIIGFLLQYGAGAASYTSSDKLIRVEDFGNTGLVSLSGAFRNAINLTSVPSQLPSTITNLTRCFFGAFNFNDVNITSWDVSNVTSIALMFSDATAFNQNIGNWNVSNVFNAVGTFFNATSFNQNLGSWDTSKFTSTVAMFYGAASFDNGGSDSINNWNIFAVGDMQIMFQGATSFNRDIGAWNVANVADMRGMFRDAISFNRNLNQWNVSNVRDMSEMFYVSDPINAPSVFNSSIIGWNTYRVTNMSFMFRGAIFNLDLGAWDTSDVVNMRGMFAAAINFNRNIGTWDVAQVTDMSFMFQSALSFNQDLSKWCVSNFAVQPEGFDENANSAWIAKPIWGTCPLDTYNLNAFFDPDTIYPTDTGLSPNASLLKWSGQNLSPTFTFEFINSNGTVAFGLSVTGNQATQNIGIGTGRLSSSWLAGRVTGTSTIDNSKVVAYARINVLFS